VEEVIAAEPIREGIDEEQGGSLRPRHSIDERREAGWTRIPMDRPWAGGIFVVGTREAA